MHHDLDKFPTTFVDYIFKVGTDGSIFFDQELTPEQLNVQSGERFEVVIVPAVGVVLKKIEGPASEEAGP